MLYTGLDIEEVKRIRRLLELKPLLLKKIFTNYEWEYSLKGNTAQTLTGIWCAKEAVVKAFSFIGDIDIRDVKINHYVNGAPYLFEINNFEFSPVYRVVLSISHTRNYAVANCIISRVD